MPADTFALRRGSAGDWEIASIRVTRIVGDGRHWRLAPVGRGAHDWLTDNDLLSAAFVTRRDAVQVLRATFAAAGAPPQYEQARELTVRVRPGVHHSRDGRYEIFQRRHHDGSVRWHISEPHGRRPSATMDFSLARAQVSLARRRRDDDRGWPPQDGR